jgi:Tfp pilus assembly protein PilF
MLANRIQDKVRMKAYFTKAQSITDTIPEVPLQIGFFYMQNKMDEDANKVFRDYEPMFPNEGQFPLLIGITYILMEEYDKALPPLHRALFLNKENLEVLLNIGHVYDQLDNTDSVHYYYGEALRLFPENPTINNNYAYFLAEHDTLLQKAKEMAFKATELEPKNSAYLDTYGWTLYKLKDYDQALTYVKMSISMGEAGAEVYEHLGDILKKRGEEKEAKQAYEEALKKEPDRISVKKKLANG